MRSGAGGGGDGAGGAGGDGGDGDGAGGDGGVVWIRYRQMASPGTICQPFLHHHKIANWQRF